MRKCGDFFSKPGGRRPLQTYFIAVIFVNIFFVVLLFYRLFFGDNEDKLLQDINALKEKIGEHETKANAIREARETAEKLINNVLLELKENTDLFEKQLQESYNKIDKVKEAYNTEIKAEKETRNEMYKSYNIYLEEVKQALQPYMQEKEIQRIGYIKLPYKKDLNYITSYGTL